MVRSKVRTLYWSHLKAYEECPRKYLWGYGWGDIDLGRGPGKGKLRPEEDSKHHAVMGIVIQAVLEDFYNKSMWTLPEMRGAELKRQLIRMTKDKLLTTLGKSWLHVDYDKMSFEEIEETCISGVIGYLSTMKHHKLLGTYAKSEVELKGHATNWLPVGGRADFIIRRDDTGTTLLDGKNSGTKMKYVDPDQLRWYALCFSLAYHKLPNRLGFAWFRYPYDEETGEEGIDWVEFSKRDLKELVDRAIKVRRGQENEKFDPTPVAKNCRFCDFETVCDARIEQRAANAAKRKRKMPSLPIADTDGITGIMEFGFGEMTASKSGEGS
jgi:hypothetical protein